MSSVFGKNVKVSIFGESHGTAIGCVVDGFPAGVTLDRDLMECVLSRRRAKSDRTTTTRVERDEPEFLSGLKDGVTTGAPIAAIFKNENTRSVDYTGFENTPRPSHSDYSATMRYRGFSDYRGGGHFSGRLTAPLCLAGALCKMALRDRGVTVAAHLAQVGPLSDVYFDPAAITKRELEVMERLAFPAVDPEIAEEMKDLIRTAALERDSWGGVVECFATGLPAGAGSPMFRGVEPVIAGALFGVPAVKGVEFGSGFAGSASRGSENNDPFRYDESGQVVTATNNHGGALGGITTGMPLVVRAAIKPTASISLPQQTVDLKQKRNTDIVVGGRHDPCIAVRAVPVIESAVAAALLDILLEGQQ